MVFDVTNARIQEMNLQIGEQVTLHLNIDCREYPQGSGKFFNSVEAWKVERASQQQVQQPAQQQFPPQVNAQGQPAPQPAPGAAPFPPQQPAPQQGQDGKLPF
jgi:hypothetical protein